MILIVSLRLGCDGIHVYRFLVGGGWLPSWGAAAAKVFFEGFRCFGTTMRGSGAAMARRCREDEEAAEAGVLVGAALAEAFTGIVGGGFCSFFSAAAAVAREIFRFLGAGADCGCCVLFLRWELARGGGGGDGCSCSPLGWHGCCSCCALFNLDDCLLVVVVVEGLAHICYWDTAWPPNEAETLSPRE